MIDRHSIPGFTVRLLLISLYKLIAFVIPMKKKKDSNSVASSQQTEMFSNN